MCVAQGCRQGFSQKRRALFLRLSFSGLFTLDISHSPRSYLLSSPLICGSLNRGVPKAPVWKQPRIFPRKVHEPREDWKRYLTQLLKDSPSFLDHKRIKRRSPEDSDTVGCYWLYRHLPCPSKTKWSITLPVSWHIMEERLPPTGLAVQEHMH